MSAKYPPATAINALQESAEEFGLQAQVKEIVKLFEPLEADTDAELEAARSAIANSNKLSDEDLKALMEQIDAEGYDSLDFFAFSLKAGLPQALVSAAEKRCEKNASLFKSAFSPEDFDMKDPLKSGGVRFQGAAQPAPATRHSKTSPQLFSQHLLHQFSLVSRQVENGLYAVKRVGNYLKKICTAEEEYSKEVLKATNHETTKLERVQGDGMKRYMTMWIGIQETCFQLGTQHSDFRAKVMSAVVLPLQAFYKEAEEKRKEILSEMTKLTRENKLVTDAVNKTKIHSLELLEKLKASQERDRGAAEPQQQKPGSMLSKLSSVLQNKFADSTATLKEKAMASCVAYQQAIDTANKTKKRLREKDFPRIFDDLQNLEVARLDVLKDHLTKFAIIFHETVSPLEELANKMVQSVAGMDTNEDINNFVESWVEVYNEPPKHVAIRYDLPCTAEELRKERWDGSMELKTDHDSIFGVTLADVMKIQAAKGISSDLPKILTALVQAIRQLRGASTEGIFRISAPKSEIDRLHREFDKGNYEVKTDSPHVPACLLKEWLREMSEALIPDSLYQQCVDIAREADNMNASNANTSSNVVQLFDSLPPLTKNCIIHLFGLLAEVIRNKEVTRMTTENIAIVFAPSFLRCESDDPTVMMTNSKYETKFVDLLLTASLEQRLHA